MGDSSKICAFCEKENPAYTCPRCYQSYCCKTCYQDYKHISCTEDFYKEWVETCVSLNNARPETKTKMVEILKRVHKQNEDNELDSDDEDDQDDMADLNERLVNQLQTKDPDDLWDCLSPSDQAMMREVLVSQEVPLWDPWWLHKARTPSDSLQFQILNILAAYVFTARLYNGDHHDNVQETVQTLFQLSVVLEHGFTFCSAAESVYNLREQKQDIDLNDRVLRLVFDDLCQILTGPDESHRRDFVYAALFDIQNLLNRAKSNHKQEDKKKIKLAIKKVEYLLSWSQDFGSKLSECIPNLQFEIASLTENMQSIAKAEKIVQDKGKVKIVEIEKTESDE